MTSPYSPETPVPHLPRDEVEALAQYLAAWDAAVDVEMVQDEWPEWDRPEFRHQALQFIRMHDALTAFRAGNRNPLAGR